MTPEEYGRFLREQLKDNPAFQEFSRELHQASADGAKLLERCPEGLRSL